LCSGFAGQRLGDAKKADAFFDSIGQSLNPEDVAQPVLFSLQQPKHLEIAQLVVLPFPRRAETGTIIQSLV
jgi:NADP-dependent 3-hydroxy acid dehydrogenase YdfG